jgi:DNA-binding NtrC family response regulator
MIELNERIKHIASLPPRANVLIHGETGVGKEIMARSLHEMSTRSHKPFVVVNCAAIAESLFERELFGNKKGAYTDAKFDEIGYFERAEGGTILLDEIGELSRTLQAKLLRIVEENKVFRIGDPIPRDTDLRIIAATNQNLEMAVEKGSFRKDLYYRLAAVEIEIPALRRRPADIPVLAEFLLDEECRGYGLPAPIRLAPQTLEKLLQYEYPGNVRELRAALSFAILQCRGELILPEHLPRRMRARRVASLESLPTDSSSQRRVAEYERMTWALNETAGNQTRAAKLIHMPLRTFVSRLEAFGIARPKMTDAHERRLVL